MSCQGEVIMKILITNISYHCSVGAVKLLRKSNIDNLHIVGCSEFDFGFCCGSLMVDKYYKVSSKEQAEQYIQQIIKICIENQIDFIISADEKEQLLFIENKAFFEKRTVLLDRQIIETFVDKYAANLAISQLGLKVPKIYQKEDLSLYSTSKIIVREKVSCCSYGIQIIDNPTCTKINGCDLSNSFIQEYINGDEYTVDVLCDINGTPQYIIPRKRIAIRNGITYKCLIENNELLISNCKKIYKEYYIPGFSNVQFIVRNGEAYFIELNPRLGGTTIASSLVTKNLMEEYVNHFYNGQAILSDSSINWNTIITRYYEEKAYTLKE